MKTKFLKPAIRSLLVLAVYLPFLAATTGGGDAGPVPEFSGRINAFALDLLKHEAAADASHRGGAMVSPLSVYSGLAMSYAASGGATRSGLAHALHFPADNSALLRDLASLRRKMVDDGNRPGSELRMADSIWLDTTYAGFRTDYLHNIGSLGVEPARQVKFAERDKARAEINGWVSAMTHARIPQSIQPSDIASRSHQGLAGDVIDEPGLVTMDAVWFKSGWMHRFDDGGTMHRMFNMPGGGTDAAMMHQQSPFLYAEDARFKLLDMPYRGGRYSMVILLPRETTSVNAMLAPLAQNTIMDLLRRASPRAVDVLFPRFTLKCHTDLKGALAAMGAAPAFDSRSADFDAMIVKQQQSHRVYLSGVHHDAWMEVNEEGAEAAAVTTSTNFTVGCSAQEPPPPAEFHADHPFLFFIVHNPTRAILFAGWMSDPAALEAGD